MKGNIYTDEKCSVCGGTMKHDDRKRGLYCSEHDQIAASSRFYVVFGRQAKKRCSSYIAATRLLNYMRFQEDEGIFDAREFEAGKPLALNNAINKWFKLREMDVGRGKLQKGTLKSYRPAVKRAIEFFGDKNIKTINKGDIEDWANWILDLQKSSKTTYNDVNTLHAFFNSLVDREVIRNDEIPGFPEIPYTMERRKIIDLDLQQTILDEVKEKNSDRAWLGIQILARHPNVRPGELVMVDEGDVNLSIRQIQIRNGKEKKHKDKVINLLDDEVEFLRSLPRGFPSLPLFRHGPGVQGCKDGDRFGQSYFYKCWKAACKTLGVDGVSLYPGTKHTTVSAIGNAAGRHMAQASTGHATNKAFERYYEQSQAAELEVLSIRDTLLGKGKHVGNIKKARN